MIRINTTFYRRKLVSALWWKNYLMETFLNDPKDTVYMAFLCWSFLVVNSCLIHRYQYTCNKLIAKRQIYQSCSSLTWVCPCVTTGSCRITDPLLGQSSKMAKMAFSCGLEVYLLKVRPINEHWIVEIIKIVYQYIARTYRYRFYNSLI